MNKKTSSKAAGFGIASVWFGSHCGGGFATGTLAANYYVKYGAWALFMPLIALAIMVVVVVIQWEVCRSNKVYNYRSFGDVLYRPQQKIWSTVFEIMFVVDVTLPGHFSRDKGRPRRHENCNAALPKLHSPFVYEENPRRKRQYLLRRRRGLAGTAASKAHAGCPIL